MAKKKVEKKLRPLDNWEDDFIEYAVNRLSLEEGEEKELTKDSIYHALHLLWQFDSTGTGYKYLIGFLSNVYDFYAEFENKFGDRYDTTCDCCKEKLENGVDPTVEVDIDEDEDGEGC